MMLNPSFAKHNRTRKNPLNRENLIKIEIGAFKADDNYLRCNAYVTQDSTFVRYICLKPNIFKPDIGKRRAMFVEYTDTLINNLEKISLKYKEWTSISKSNHTGKFSKYIEIPIPLLGYDEGVESEFTYLFTFPEEKEKCFYFNVWSDYEDPTIVLAIDDNNDPHIPCKCRLYFKNCEEFDSFVDFLKYENIQKRIRNTTINKLFK